MVCVGYVIVLGCFSDEYPYGWMFAKCLYKKIVNLKNIFSDFYINSRVGLATEM